VLPVCTRIISLDKSAYLIPVEHIPHTFVRLDLLSSKCDEFETFKTVLSQFAAYSYGSSAQESRPNRFRGRTNFGSVPQAKLAVHGDPVLSQPGHEKESVVIGINTDSKTHKHNLIVSLSTVDYRSQSSLVRMADKISSGIIVSSDAIARGINFSVNRYISRRPRPTPDLPVTFQLATLERVRKIHHLSISAVAMSAKATGFVASAVHSVGAGVRQKICRRRET
jgi:Senescence-associated protein